MKPQEEVAEESEMLDLRGALTCTAKSEESIPSIFQLPHTTVRHALGDITEGVGDAAVVRVGEGERVLDLSSIVPSDCKMDVPEVR